MEGIENEYKKVRKALEFIMPAIMGKMGEKDFKRIIIEKRKEQLMINREDKDSPCLIFPP